MLADSRPSVLIVEDDEAISIVLSLALESIGFDTASARDGQDGLRQAADRLFDLFLLDQMMPGMLGIEVAQQLTRQSRGARDRIILITAGPVPARASDFVCRVIRKPFEIEEVLEALCHMIGRELPPAR
jgi:two-component system phosphate regulon response regulator PhoB